MFFQFMKSNKEIDRIMPLRAGKTQEERDIRVQGIVVAEKQEKCKAKIVLI